MRKVRQLVSVVAAIGCAMGFVANAYAIDIKVNTLEDSEVPGDGKCSLREAIRAANTDTSAGGDCQGGITNDTVKFEDGLTGTIVLSGSLPSIDGVKGKLTIEGNGVVLNSQSTGRAIDIKPGAYLDLSNITIVNGSDDTQGGAIRNNNGTLILSNAVVSGSVSQRDGGAVASLNGLTVMTNVLMANSTAGEGGGLYVLGGAVNLNGVTVSGNKMIQRGGGIYLNGNVDATINNLYVYNNEGTVVGANTAGAGIYISMTKPLAIGNAVISSNEARNGGGIYIQSGNVTLVDSSIVGNAAELRGGGILADGDGLTIERSTISGNGAKNGAGVTLNTTTGAPSTNTVSIKDTTIAGNIGSTSASSLLVYTGTTVSLNSVILSSGDVRRTNCEIEGGVVTDGGRVLSTDATCQLTSSTSITNTNVPVGALINYGGQVGASYQRGQQQAQLPLPYSSRGACTVNTTDRTIVCDIGAVKATYRSNFLPITIKP